MMRRVATVVAFALVAAPAASRGQGALSELGFGYPIGQLSTRALGVGGSLATIDPQSPLNPAAIVLNARSLVYIQYEPEFRTVNAGAQGTKTTTIRFPVFSVNGRQGPVTYGISFSSFLDRTWANQYADTQVVNGEKIASTVLTESQGGISDARVAFAYSFGERLHLGVSGHLYPGQNRILVGRIFADSAKAGNFTVGNQYNFSGSGITFGIVAVPAEHFVLSADARFGGTLTMKRGDTATVGSGKIPGRYEAGLAYDGVTGSVFAIRISHERWSDLRGLGSEAVGLRDVNEIALGAEVTGPKFQDNPTYFRAGVRMRDLPFSYSGAAVSERSVTVGGGIPIANGRTIIDFGLARVSRNASSVSEGAWQVSVGLGIRP